MQEKYNKSVWKQFGIKLCSLFSVWMQHPCLWLRFQRLWIPVSALEKLCSPTRRGSLLESIQRQQMWLPVQHRRVPLWWLWLCRQVWNLQSVLRSHLPGSVCQWSMQLWLQHAGVQLGWPWLWPVWAQIGFWNSCNCCWNSPNTV